MNQARRNILNHIRKSYRRNELEPEIVKSLEARLAAAKVHEQPTIGNDLISIFFKQLEKVATTFESIPHAKEIPFAILAFLQKHHLPQELVIDSRLEGLPWPNKLRLACRAAHAKDVVSVSRAFAGIAETGSLVLLSSASPTTLNFLPDNHIVVLYKDDLVGYIEEVWTRLRAQAMPRTVNLITGPSRTADIEQTIQLGAHGPRRLHLIFVDS